MGIRGEMQMIERAIKKRWLTTDELKANALEAVQRGLNCGDKRAEQRAIANLLAMEAQNQKDEHKVVDVNVSTRHDKLPGIAADLGIDLRALPDATGQSESSVTDVDGTAAEDATTTH